MKRYFLLCAAAFMLAAAIGFLHTRSVVHAAAIMTPRFEVDPYWPKPLPNHWILGQTIGVSADPQDHIWIIHRVGSLEAGEQHATTNPRIAQCCAPAPPVLEFDQEGNLIGALGRPGTRVTIGRNRRMESRWITKATSGWAAMAVDPKARAAPSMARTKSRRPATG